MNWIPVPKHKGEEREKFWAQYAPDIFRPGTLLKLRTGRIVLVGHDQVFDDYKFSGVDIIGFNPNLIRPMNIIIQELAKC